MVIAGVASNRRDPRKEPAKGWAQHARTIALTGFGDNPTEFTWYNRSSLGHRFGQALVDEEMAAFRADVGQDVPLAPKRRASKSSKLPAPDHEAGSELVHSNTVSQDSTEKSSAALMANIKALEEQINQMSKLG